MTDLSALLRLRLNRARALLLDFDGPICSVFHAHPPLRVTRELADGVDAVRAAAPAVPDDARRLGPHDFLAWVAQARPTSVEGVEQHLARFEQEAVADAPPTPYALDVVRAAATAGLRIAIVSNNAGVAIERFLALHAVADVEVVVGRPGARLERMKPDPWPVLEAARLLGVQPGDCVLVGDSPSDVAAGRAAGVPVVGYAAAAPERSALSEAGADVVLESMGTLEAASLPPGQ